MLEPGGISKGLNDVPCTEVPTALKRLVRLILRAFYSQEQAIIVDYLIRYPCVREDDLADLLRFDRKQLRSALALLREDHFIKTRQRMETGPDGRANRQTFYYIHYKVFINVVLYKLDHIRRRFENDERDSTSRASFRCTKCSNTYTDLEIDRLLNFETGELRCTFCGAEVEEDDSALPKQDSRMLLAKFNEQMEPFYALLREVGDLKFAPSVLEPEPTEIPHIRGADKREENHLTSNNPGAKRKKIDGWADSSKNSHFNRATDITVNIGPDLALDQPQEAREQPIWMTQSTVLQPQTLIPSTSTSNTPAEDLSPGPTLSQHQDIMNALLAHEKKSTKTPYIPGQTSGEESDTSESDEETQEKAQKPKPKKAEDVEEMDSDDDDDEAIVFVQGQKVLLSDVTEEHVAKMTPIEKGAYIKISQEVYQSLYE